MEKFTIGLLLGGVMGAVLVSNNWKMRALVKKCQGEVKQKADEIIDEKLKEMEQEEEEEEKSSKKRSAKSKQ